MSAGDANRTTEQLTEAWVRSVQYVRSCKETLRKAREEAQIAEKALAEHLAPSDMQTGERIGIWVRFSDHEEKLVVVTAEADPTEDREELQKKFFVTLRGEKRADELDDG